MPARGARVGHRDVEAYAVTAPSLPAGTRPSPATSIASGAPARTSPRPACDSAAPATRKPSTGDTAPEGGGVERHDRRAGQSDAAGRARDPCGLAFQRSGRAGRDLCARRGGAGGQDRWAGGVDVTERHRAQEALAERESGSIARGADLGRRTLGHTRARGRTWAVAPDLMGAPNADGAFEISTSRG